LYYCLFSITFIYGADSIFSSKDGEMTMVEGF